MPRKFTQQRLALWLVSAMGSVVVGPAASFAAELAPSQTSAVNRRTQAGESAPSPQIQQTSQLRLALASFAAAEGEQTGMPTLADAAVAEEPTPASATPAPAAQPAVPDLSPSTTADDSATTWSEAAGAVPQVAAAPAKPAAKKPNPCAESHKGVFYNNDFKYLKDPKYNGCCLGDGLKLMPVGACGEWGTLDVGGQSRLRYHREIGMGQNPGTTRFQDTSNDFLLTRLRLYSDWKVNDVWRFYAEGTYAGLNAPDDYVPRPIDENYGDLLNAFVDTKLTDSTTVRLGRQELLYGSQRVVSPLDWANARRTFEGVNVLIREGDWAIDTFYTNLVLTDPTRFDEADYDQSLYGFYSVYSGVKNHTFDFYYLGYDHQTAGAPIVTDFSLHTLGMRLNGSQGDWLYELEGAPQFGRESGLGLDQRSGFYTAGIGRKLKQLPWNSTVWFYYDYAAGNNLGGTFNRYNQLFPLVHKYLGFIDATQRSNIESPNVLFTTNPTEKLSLLVWYYHLMSNQDSEIVPSVGATPAQSTVSKDWGDELDLIATYKCSARSQILFGWSHFWAGSKIVAPNTQDADFFYTEWTVNF